MKKVVFILMTFVLFFSCKKEKIVTETQSNSLIKSKINTLLDNWHKAAATANYEAYFNKLDSVSVYIGTDASEIWGKTQFSNFSKPYFDRGKAWSFKAIDRNVYISKNKDFVYFDELLNTWMGTCRGSGVLEKKDNFWKIKHYVLSITIPNEDVQAVIKAKQKNDSIFLKNFKK